MKRSWSLVLLSLALSACSQSQSRQVVDNAPEGGYPARMVLGNISLPMDSAPAQPKGGVWQAAGTILHFGVPGQADLLALRCVQANAGSAAAIEIVRHTRAEDGAKALFALIGNGRVSRLPVNSVRGGESGEWRGALAVDDARLDVLKGGNRIEATLPGGGTLLLPASGEPGRLLASCRAAAGSAA